jgi:hypothetical protein
LQSFTSKSSVSSANFSENDVERAKQHISNTYKDQSQAYFSKKKTFRTEHFQPFYINTAREAALSTNISEKAIHRAENKHSSNS